MSTLAAARQTDNLDPEDLLPFLVAVQPGVSAWVRDEDSCLNEEDYSFEVNALFRWVRGIRPKP